MQIKFVFGSMAAGVIALSLVAGCAAGMSKTTETLQPDFDSGIVAIARESSMLNSGIDAVVFEAKGQSLEPLAVLESGSLAEVRLPIGCHRVWVSFYFGVEYARAVDIDVKSGGRYFVGLEPIYMSGFRFIPSSAEKSAGLKKLKVSSYEDIRKKVVKWDVESLRVKESMDGMDRSMCGRKSELAQ